MTDAQFIVPDPVIVAAVLNIAAFWRVMPAVTVRITLELTDRLAALLLVSLKTMDLIVAFSVTVRLAPATITASSPENGTTCAW